MSTALPLPWSTPKVSDQAKTEFVSIFGLSPLAAARCDHEGMVLEWNPAFEQAVAPGLVRQHTLHLSDLVPVREAGAAEALLGELLKGTRNSVCLEGFAAGHTPAIHWTAWRQPGSAGATEVFVIGGRRVPGTPEDSLLQAQRWEAVGRLAGGAVHDFNNLLTGVMLYCDLVLSSLDTRDRRRRYAEEIRSAVIQASGLVKQLLVFARPRAGQARLLSLNQIVEGMRDLLSLLIGVHIALELRLDPDLGLLRMEQAQAQQILLNLVLNARDAMPEGGRIVIETSNCKFQTVNGSGLGRPGAAAFPCVLLAVGDNGLGMDAKTRERLFEPFFTTKSAGQGTGLGLTTVRGIVISNRGLIHVESELGRGTRVMILLPRATPSSSHELLQDSATSHPEAFSPVLEAKKESHL